MSTWNHTPVDIHEDVPEYWDRKIGPFWIVLTQTQQPGGWAFRVEGESGETFIEGVFTARSPTAAQAEADSWTRLFFRELAREAGK